MEKFNNNPKNIEIESLGKKKWSKPSLIVINYNKTNEGSTSADIEDWDLDTQNVS
jgi:hypothetical protein